MLEFEETAARLGEANGREGEVPGENPDTSSLVSGTKLPIDFALAYAKNGYEILPVYEIGPDGHCACPKGSACQFPGKHPRTPHGVNDATNDLDRIRDWWERWPRANIAMVPAGFCVIDVDPRNAGDASPFEQRCHAHSGGGGNHFLFKPVMDAATSKGFLRGLDFNPGYFLVEPSNHRSTGTYRWLDASNPLTCDLVSLYNALPELPAWIVDALEAAETKLQSDWKKFKPAAVGSVAEGGRDHYVTAFAASYYVKSKAEPTFDTVVTALRKENARACVPPLDDSSIVAKARRAAGSSRLKEWRATRVERPSSQSDKLFQLFDDFEFFHSGPARDAYVRLMIGNHREVWALGNNGGRVREILTHRYYEKHGKAPSGESLTSAIETIRAKCRAATSTEVYVRFARGREVIYLDLGDDEWRAVKITAAGWEVVTDCTVLFKRPNGALPLPVPVRGGSLDALRPLLNGGDDQQWTLIIGWLIGVFLPGGSFPHLIVEGAKGSGKTTAVSMLQSFLDPSTAGLSGPPKNEEDAILSALNTGILAFDNLSGCRADFSDMLCRFSTGAAFRTRTFYSNTDITLIHVKLPCLLNGIDASIMRDDMMERSITLTLPYIAPINRMTEDYVWNEFHRVHAGCLGAVLDMAVIGLRNLETTVLKESPRMADFCRWVTACDPAGGFLKAFVARQRESNAILIENHELAQAIVELVIGDEWVPTSGYREVSIDEFYRKLNPTDETGRPLAKHDLKYWPQSAISLSHKLKRLQSLLKDGGIEITKLPRKKAVRSKWNIQRLDSPQGTLKFEDAA
jgi:hypothetical protein